MDGISSIGKRPYQLSIESRQVVKPPKPVTRISKVACLEHGYRNSQSKAPAVL